MRISTRTWLVLTVAIAVSFGLVGSSAAGQKCNWKVTLLDGPASEDWAGTLANDISDSGLIGGAWFDTDMGWHAAYWRKGKCYDVETECGIPSDCTQSNIMSINAKGQMGGYAYENPFFQQAILWNVNKDSYTNLHPDDWDASLIYGVNARGDCVGYVVEDPSLTNPVVPWWVHAYVWPKCDRDGFTLPGTYDYVYSEAFGINASGTIVGWGVTFNSDGTDLVYHALVWKKNAEGEYELIDLHDEEFDGETWVDTGALDISERGKIVGRVWADKGVPSEPYEWTSKGGFDLLPVASETDVQGVAWKAVGKYIAGGVGEGRTWLGQAISDKAAVWVKGKLDVVVDEKGDYTSFESSSVNRKGIVVGFAIMDDDEDPTTTEDDFPSGFVASRK